jgi:hypothetical protein
VRSLIGEINLEAAESEVNPMAALPDLGLPGLPLPSLQRVYVHFCEPVDTATFAQAQVRLREGRGRIQVHCL